MRFTRAHVLLVTALVASGGAVVPAATAQAAGTVSATLVRTTATGAGSTWAAQGHPSPDPSGITYNSRTGNLIISDGEVEETNLSWHVWRGTNLYISSRAGTLLPPTGLDTMTSAQGGYSKEPTGVGFRPSFAMPERLFVSDDDQAKIFEVDGVNGTYGDIDDRWTASSVAFLNLGARNDAEDVAVNLDTTKNGQLLLVDGKGKRAFLYNPGNDGVFDGVGDHIETKVDLGAMGAGDPEGIAYNASRNTMFVLDDPSNRLYEVGLDGTLLNRITLDFTMKSGAGLAFAPPSSSSSLVCGTPTSVACNVYIVDRGVDNDSNSSTFNDGRLYEVKVPGLTGGGTAPPTNAPPVVDAGEPSTVTVPGPATLYGSVRDPESQAVTAAWMQVGGPAGGATIESPKSEVTKVTFTAEGLYTFQLQGGDGVNFVTDEVVVTVNPASGGSGGTLVKVDVPVRAGGDDAEEKSTGTMVVSSGDLNMALDGSTRQTIGMRFTGLNIPASAKIQTAYVQFQVDEVTTGSPSLTIVGQAAPSPPAFTTMTGNITSRTPTSVKVLWNPPSWGSTVGVRGQAQQTAELAPVIQQMVSSGWANNALVLLISGSTGTRTAESFEGGATKAPVLHIEYTQ